MNLRKLPPSMLLALGLSACNDGGTSDSNAEGGASSMDSTGTPGATSTTSPTNSTAAPTTGTTTEAEASACLDVGPCLFDIPPTDLPSDTSTGPCLQPPMETDTDTDTGTGTGTGTGTTGAMGDEPPDARANALQRVISRGTLPPDVAARLQGGPSEDE